MRYLSTLLSCVTWPLHENRKKEIIREKNKFNFLFIYHLSKLVCRITATSSGAPLGLIQVSGFSPITSLKRISRRPRGRLQGEVRTLNLSLSTQISHLLNLDLVTLELDRLEMCIEDQR